VLLISAVTGLGLNQLVREIVRQLDLQKQGPEKDVAGE